MSTLVIQPNKLSIPNELGRMDVEYSGTNFEIVKRDGTRLPVQRADLSSELRGISKTTLEKLLETGYLQVSHVGNDLAITHKQRGLGGGPISGAIAYWATKTVCYGTAAAAAGTIVVATGGAAGAVTGAIAAGSTAGASTAATITAGAIAGAGLAGEAATVTTAVVASAGSVAGAVAAVESASFSMGAIFTAIPFLP